MIGQQTIEGYLVQLFILGQPLIWINLLESERQFREDSKYGFYFIGFVFIWIVAYTKYSIGFYTTRLLLLYPLMVMASTYIYNQRKPIKEAISYGFLTVFLNSFYWELPLHLAEILTVGYHIGMMVQFWRLYPATYLIPRIRIGKQGKLYLIMGLCFSTCLMVIRYTPIFPDVLRFNPMLHVINRIVCLGILVKTIVEDKGIN